MKIRDISLSRIEPFGTRDTAAKFGTVPKNSGRLATLIWIIASLLTDITAMESAAYWHDVADSWLLKDDTEVNEVMESGSEFHSVIVLAAKDF